MCTEEKLGKNNNSAHLRECFIEKQRKSTKNSLLADAEGLNCILMK
jgi:hypothetical protein